MTPWLFHRTQVQLLPAPSSRSQPTVTPEPMYPIPSSGFLGPLHAWHMNKNKPILSLKKDATSPSEIKTQSVVKFEMIQFLGIEEMTEQSRAFAALQSS